MTESTSNFLGGICVNWSLAFTVPSWAEGQLCKWYSIVSRTVLSKVPYSTYRPPLVQRMAADLPDHLAN